MSRRLASPPRRLRRAPLLLLAAGLLVVGLLAAVVISLLERDAVSRAEPDPHTGQVYINDGVNQVWHTPLEGVPVSDLLPEEFDRAPEQDDRVRYLGTEYATRWGVDVSNYQGTIDWDALKQQGVTFAYLRLGFRGYTAGALQPDRSFEQYYQGARDAGIDVGVYFFSQAVTVREAAEEARCVLETLDGRELSLPVYYDWEPVSAEDSRTLDNASLLLTAQARAFCRVVELGGYDAGVYMSRQQGYYRYHLAALQDWSLWIADYGDYPDFYYRFDLWQYSDAGTLSGISAPVDLNLEFRPVG